MIFLRFFPEGRKADRGTYMDAGKTKQMITTKF